MEVNQAPSKGEAMKFILNGRTFDTATATRVAVNRKNYLDYDSGHEVRLEETLYRTTKGAHFSHWHETRKGDKGKPQISDAAVELSAHAAVEWIEKEGAVILDASSLPLPPEA